MNIEFVKKHIEQMDKKTQEFADLFHFINDKYFDFDKPDEFQKSAQLLNAILHRGEEWQIEACVKLLSDLVRVGAKGGCYSSMIGVKGEDEKIRLVASSLAGLRQRRNLSVVTNEPQR